MKLFCDACQRILPAGSWSVIDGELRLRCAGCGAEAKVERPGPARLPAEPPNVYAGPAVARLKPPPRVLLQEGGQTAATPPPPPAETVDRALAAFVEPTPGPSVSPAGSSLAAQEVAAAMSATAAEPTMDDEPWLEIGWARLQQSWSDAAAHRRLITEAAARGDFAGLGKRYRDHLAQKPDDAVAIAARDELLQKATAELFIRLPAEEGGLAPERARLLRNLLLVIFFLGLLLFGGWVLLSMGGVS